MRSSSERAATTSDLTDIEINKNGRKIISYPEQMPDISDISVRVLFVFQSTLELEELIQLFDNEMSSILTYTYLRYSNQAEDIDIKLGNPEKHVVQYQIDLLGQELGALELSRNTGFLDDEIAEIEKLISALIYPLRNALLYKKAVEQSYIDPLTGVGNRAEFDKSLEQEINLTQRHGNALTLMTLDIDHFKEINDNYGHAAGDVALKSFVDCINDCLRRSDTMYRYGGEEFMVVLRNTGLDGAALLAERMRKKVEDMQFVYESVQLDMTVSIGVSQFIKGEKSQCLVERVDKLLYKAKESGRNCIKTE